MYTSYLLTISELRIYVQKIINYDYRFFVFIILYFLNIKKNKENIKKIFKKVGR